MLCIYCSVTMHPSNKAPWGHIQLCWSLFEGGVFENLRYFCHQVRKNINIERKCFLEIMLELRPRVPHSAAPARVFSSPSGLPDYSFSDFLSFSS